MDEAAIRTLIDSLHQAYHDKATAAIVAGCAPDARIFDFASPLAHRGISSRRRRPGYLGGADRA
jgi:hypothetical protein